MIAFEKIILSGPSVESAINCELSPHPSGISHECLAVPLREGEVLITDGAGKVVRLTSSAWQTLVQAIKNAAVVDSSTGGKLAEASSQLSVTTLDDPVTALEVAVFRLNHRQQLVTGRPEEVIRTCRQIHDPIVLRRPPGNEPEFTEFIGALARWLYDGTNGVTSPRNRGKVKPTLPKWCYRDVRSVIVHLIALRNHYVHSMSPDEAVAQEHLASAAEVFEIYARKRIPDDPDFAGICTAMLYAAIRLADRLATHVPVGDQTYSESVFDSADVTDQYWKLGRSFGNSIVAGLTTAQGDLASNATTGDTI